MPTPAIRHEEDRTGLNPDNLVINESHTLLPRQRRILVPLYGPYYTESLVITDVNTGKQLKTTDYFHADFVQTAQWLSGKEVASTIVITNRSISNNISINYQCFGGAYNVNAEVLKAQIQALALDNRPVLYDKILGKPSAFAPAAHLHDVGDVFGWEYVVFVLERIRSAIEMGDENSHLAIYDYIDQQLSNLRTNVQNLVSTSNAHSSRTDNPHNVTAEQVGTYTKAKIDDLLQAISSRLSSDSLTHSSRRDNPHNVTAAQLKVYLKTEVDGLLTTLRTQLTTTINNHVNNRANPHRVTAEQVGTYDKATIDQKIATVDVSSVVSSHANLRNNPHGVTAAQVGTYTKAEIDGKDSNLNTTLSKLINDHKALKNNPHAVTAAQVGAYTKTEVDTRTGNINTALTKLINDHKALKNNPHGVTAAQVGTYTKVEIDRAIAAANSTAALNNHVANYNNPHRVTAAQVGTLTTTQINSELSKTKTAYEAAIKVLNDKLLDTRNKIKSTAIPFSTDTRNSLTWRNDGLFVNLNPHTITQDTQNYFGGDGHSHNIAWGTTAVRGIVQLFGGLDRAQHDMALSSGAGKHIGDRLIALEARPQFPHTISPWGPPGNTNGYAENHIWFQFV